MRPTQSFKVKHLVGMDLHSKEEEKLSILRDSIRHFLDIYEQERLDMEIERNRQMKNQQRSF